MVLVWRRRRLGLPDRHPKVDDFLGFRKTDLAMGRNGLGVRQRRVRGKVGATLRPRPVERRRYQRPAHAQPAAFRRDKPTLDKCDLFAGTARRICAVIPNLRGWVRLSPRELPCDHRLRAQAKNRNWSYIKALENGKAYV